MLLYVLPCPVPREFVLLCLFKIVQDDEPSAPTVIGMVTVTSDKGQMQSVHHTGHRR